MINEQTLKDRIPREVVRKLLQRIYSDPHFALSVMLKRLLSFIVEETLAGRSEQLTEHSIAVTIFKKAADPLRKDDPFVSVHMERLRRALDHYYKNAGVNATIHIAIPNGTYIAVFKDAAQSWND